MTAPVYTYIESDFASADETCAEYRKRTATHCKPHRLRRVRRLLISGLSAG